jgi:3-oxoacyl-[acyl-carrier-protein] synthase-3
MRPLGIDGIAVALPPGQLVSDLAGVVGLSADAASALRSNGLSTVPVAETGPFIDFALQSVDRILAEFPDARADICIFLLAHSAPLLTPGDGNVLADLIDRAGLGSAISFVFAGQPCAVLHTAVHWALSALDDRVDGSALVVGADRANHPDERFFFGSAMGDASIALLLGRRSDRARIVGGYQHTELHASEGEWSPPSAIAAFRERNPLLIRFGIERCLEQAGCRLEDLAAIVPHTPYLSIWDTVARLLRYPRERIVTDYIADTGHLSSNDSFVHFHRATLDGRINPGDLVLLVNPGFGGSRGFTLIQV